MDYREREREEVERKKHTENSQCSSHIDDSRLESNRHSIRKFRKSVTCTLINDVLIEAYVVLCMSFSKFQTGKLSNGIDKIWPMASIRA